MSDTKFTPGPWINEENFHIRDAAGNSLMCAEQYYPWVPENDADWNLIAAAPEMYAACQKALARGCSCNCNMGKEWHSDACSIPLIRSALAKATGVKP